MNPGSSAPPTPVGSDAGGRPTFLRPSRRHALDLARDMFVDGERLDMQTLANALGVGRTTLYRWVGDREALLSRVLADLTDQAWDTVIAEARGTGAARSLDAARRFMELTAAFEPLRKFAEREPQLALRVLLAPNGLVAERIRAGATRSLEHAVPGEPVDPELVDIAVQVGTALEWAPIAIGAPPEIERAIRLIGSLYANDGRMAALEPPRERPRGKASRKS